VLLSATVSYCRNWQKNKDFTAMTFSIPSLLSSLSSAGNAIKSITDWWKKSRGDTRVLLGELKDNLIYLEMVGRDGVPLAAVIDKLSLKEYQRLAKEGFDFNQLKREIIIADPSLTGTDLQYWAGKDTAALLESICSKINELKLRYPLQKDDGRQRWGVRVNNIRKKIWLLLKHTRD
jgi:hypothetical protein